MRMRIVGSVRLGEDLISVTELRGKLRHWFINDWDSDGFFEIGNDLAVEFYDDPAEGDFVRIETGPPVVSGVVA